MSDDVFKIKSYSVADIKDSCPGHVLIHPSQKPSRALREPEFKIPDKRRDEYKWEEWGTLVEVKSAKKSVILGVVFGKF